MVGRFAARLGRAYYGFKDSYFGPKTSKTVEAADPNNTASSESGNDMEPETLRKEPVENTNEPSRIRSLLCMPRDNTFYRGSSRSYLS